VARIYDPVGADDGARVLVDRLWPRGITKAGAPFDRWCREVAPSTELRRWYGHDPSRFDAFAARYRAELENPVAAQALDDLRVEAGRGNLTLLTATKEIALSHLAVLADLLS
jgi:uncharacterized protein YeaO (DUF488 family)